jgi:hypothetical protein
LVAPFRRRCPCMPKWPVGLRVAPDLSVNIPRRRLTWRIWTPPCCKAASASFVSSGSNRGVEVTTALVSTAFGWSGVVAPGQDEECARGANR